MPQAEQQRRVYRVTEITRAIKHTLEDTFGMVWVEGEISNLRRPASGHLYFTLKDEGAQIQGVLFRGNQGRLTFAPRDGLKVRAYGQVSVYERSGQYQLIIRAMEEAGKGSLQEAFEALKKKLHAEGLFDADRKQPLPQLPRRIGVVTSPTGAAIRDILNVVNRRFPNLHVLVAPARVQGEQAAAEVAAGIDLLNEWGQVDVMIVGRGGGSIEDLWCFNEETVARAIARSSVPVISAVGHEIDFTISDFVADLRAPTPSAAAELVVGCKEAFEEQLAAWQRRMIHAQQTRLLHLRNRLTAVARHAVFHEPRHLTEQYAQHLDQLHQSMTHSLQEKLRDIRERLRAARESYVFREPANLLRQHRQQLSLLQTRSQHALVQQKETERERVARLRMRMLHQAQNRRDDARHRLKGFQDQLRMLNPLAVLDRGYSLTRRPDGTIVRTVTDLKPGDKIQTQMAKGWIGSSVEETTEEAPPNT